MHDDNDQAATGGRAEAGGPPAAAGGLDLSLGHVGTQPLTARWYACCDACRYTLSDEEYTAAEAAAGPEADPRCPGCGRMSPWSFHRQD